MIEFGYFIKQLPTEEYIEEYGDGFKINRTKYPVECYFFKPVRSLQQGKVYTHVNAYYSSEKGDIIDIFVDD